MTYLEKFNKADEDPITGVCQVCVGEGQCQEWIVERADDCGVEPEWLAMEINLGRLPSEPDENEIMRHWISTRNIPVIFVRGGCVEVVDFNGESILVDYDNLESGCCPVCGTTFEINEDQDFNEYCDLCKIDWDDEPIDLVDVLRKSEE